MVDAAPATEAVRIAPPGTELESEGVAYGDLSLCLSVYAGTSRRGAVVACVSTGTTTARVKSWLGSYGP